MHNTHNRKRKERVQIRVQIANRFITKKELDSAYFCLGEINEHKVIAVIIVKMKIMLFEFFVERTFSSIYSQ